MSMEEKEANSHNVRVRPGVWGGKTTDSHSCECITYEEAKCTIRILMTVGRF